MRNITKFNQSNALMAIGFGIIMLSFLTTTGVPTQSQSASTVASMSISPLSSSDSTQDIENECSNSSEQTVVQWKYMQWFHCKYSFMGICIWPPLQRKHYTYKITIHNGNPLRDENGNPIVIAKGKIRDWEVYDSTAWNQIQDSPRHLARYPDYEPIASDEYVVMVETRYRWFNDVEATLRLCVQQP